MEKTPNKKLVFVIDEYGRTLTKESMHKLISELFDKALGERNVDAVVVNGHGINTCANLMSQINGQDITAWELIYFHGSKYPPVLLNHDNKEKLIILLPEYKGASADAVYKVLVDSGTFSEFE